LALAEGRLTYAELEYAKAASLIKDFFPSSDPKNPDLQRFQRQIYTGQTSVAEGRRDWKGAKSSAAQWMAVAGTDKKQIAQAELRMARAEFFSDDLASAKDHLQAAYKNDPEVGHPLVSLALLTAQKGDKDNPQRAIDEADKYMLDAVSQIKNESTAKPETVAAVYAAASQWMLNNNKLSDAARYASDAVKADPKSDAFQRLTALIALYQKNWIEAEKLLDGMYQKSPGDVFVTANLSLALAGAAGENTTEAEKAKMKKAVDLAEINFKSNQKSAELAATLGWIYFRAGRYDEAEQLLQGAVQLNNGQLSSSTAYYLSQVLARRRRFDDAIKILAGALESAGPFPYREEAVKMMKTWDPSWKEKAPATAKTESSDSAPKTDTTPKKSDTPAKKN
jgi:tetratricopeptide (TPR) repeat protein